MSKQVYHVRVMVDVAVDFEGLSFPTDKNGMLIWPPTDCIEDYISHTLFKEHDASHMCDLGHGLHFQDWTVDFPKPLVTECFKVLLRNVWDHPQTQKARELRTKYTTFDGCFQGEMKKVEKIIE